MFNKGNHATLESETYLTWPRRHCPTNLTGFMLNVGKTYSKQNTRLRSFYLAKSITFSFVTEGAPGIKKAPKTAI
jgi:hypothetical protein